MTTNNSYVAKMETFPEIKTPKNQISDEKVDASYRRVLIGQAVRLIVADDIIVSPQWPLHKTSA
jgi:hypothetical protein